MDMAREEGPRENDLYSILINWMGIIESALFINFSFCLQKFNRPITITKKNIRLSEYDNALVWIHPARKQ